MSETMTSRERILAALSHEQPDRVPLDLGGFTASSIVWEAYERLKRLLGIEAENELHDRMQRIVKVDERILRTLGIDTRSLFKGSAGKGGAELGPDRYRDEWGLERVRPAGGYYYDLVNAPLSGAITVSDVAHYPWPDPDDPGYVRGLRERLDWIREHTDCAAILQLPHPVVHMSQYLRGFEDWYCDFVLNTKVMEALFDAVLEVNLAIARRLLEAVGADVDVVCCADDLGTQTGPQISHDHYVKHVKPRHEKYVRQVHDLSPAKFLLHSCGSVEFVIEDLIDIAVEALNPVQVTAKEMDPERLKKKYGGRIAFWGAMETQQVLPKGSVEEVTRMVEERIEQMGEGGGYVLSACHNVQPDVPAENIVAMFRHARDYVPSFAR